MHSISKIPRESASRAASAIALLIVLGLTVICHPLEAQIGPGARARQPTLLRITGYVDQAPPGVVVLTTVTVGVDREVLRLQAEGIQLLNGPLTEGPAALRQFELYSPNLLLIGAPELLQQVRSAAAGTKLALFGYLQPGSQRLLLVQVDVPTG